MAVYLNFLLILTGLRGIHSVMTVKEVSVKAGDSITIPCFYGSQFRNHVKYLCKGASWASCSTKVRTDRQGSSRKFSISEDKIQRIFTVTIKDVTNQDIDYYWCIVEINGRVDTGDFFYLSVTRDTPRLYVDHQEITGFNGEEVTINCRYSNRAEIEWCKLGDSCVATSGSIGGSRVAINTSVPSVFTVTMSGLRMESSGWYWCAKGLLQMPVHITVTERPTTPATTTRFTTSSPTPTRIPVTGDGPTVKNGQDSASIEIKSLIISLSLLISIAMVTVFIWFMVKRHKRTKVESSTTMAEEEVMYSNVKHRRKASSQAEEDVTYCNVGYMRKTSDQSLYAESDMYVMYSSVVAIKKQTVKRVEAEDKDVTYSTLAQHHQQI